MTLEQWAIKWGVPFVALADLRAQFVAETATEERNATALATSEAGAASQLRLEASRLGVHLWRNNVGAGNMEGGGFVRFGLANETKAQNDKIKSADYIGIRPVTITPAHVGAVIGQFVSREVKRPGWTFTGSGREEAQAAWMRLVLARGGDAGFCTGAGSL